MKNKFEGFIEGLKRSKEWLALDQLRKTTYKRYMLSWVLGIVLFVMSCGFLLFGSDSDMIMSGLGGLVMSVIIPIILVRKYTKEFSANYKTIVVPKLITDAVTSFDSNSAQERKQKNKCVYFANKHLSLEQLISFPLFMKYPHQKTIYSGEDLFKGNIGETHFQFSDVVIKRNRDLIFVDQDIDITVFRGLVFIADFHKDFNGTTTITTRKGKQYKQLQSVGSSMTTISHQFDRMFKVHTTDEVTARYLLPINMLERIIALRSLFPNKGMAICLHQGMIIISIHEHDFFEIGKARMPRSSNIMQTYTEISAILEMIEVLNLNLRIWSKK